MQCLKQPEDLEYFLSTQSQHKTKSTTPTHERTHTHTHTHENTLTNEALPNNAQDHSAYAAKPLTKGRVLEQLRTSGVFLRKAPEYSAQGVTPLT